MPELDSDLGYPATLGALVAIAGAGSCISSAKKKWYVRRLSRHLGLFALTAYAVGDILGAGIYALVGKVVDNRRRRRLGLSFGMGGLVALFTGFSYAELSRRYPVSAGAAAFVG
jgi:amino acid permease